MISFCKGVGPVGRCRIKPHSIFDEGWRFRLCAARGRGIAAAAAAAQSARAGDVQGDHGGADVEMDHWTHASSSSSLGLRDSIREFNDESSQHGVRTNRTETATAKYVEDMEELEMDEEVAEQARMRRRKAEWKRRQKGQKFLDHLIITVEGGKGGSGTVAFNREKYKPYGPPSGGNGGRGGDVYILPDPGMTSLAGVPRRVKGEAGGDGKGKWMNGMAGSVKFLKVPVGTVVKEVVDVGEGRGIKEEREEEEWRELDQEERERQEMDKRWVHYPLYKEDNYQREAFLQADAALKREQRLTLAAERARKAASGPLYLDLSSPFPSAAPSTSSSDDDDVAINAPLGTRAPTPGYLLARGGNGGLGNPAFLSPALRSPKFATRGLAGEHFTLSLELKLLADVALVGLPNAGKSTLMRALTGGRVRSEVGSWEFTTVNPIVGVVRCWEEEGKWMWEGALGGERVWEETIVEEERKAQVWRGLPAPSVSSSSAPPTRARPALIPPFTFTLTDNPGLIHQSSHNRGLGHTFLRAIERAKAIVYVVDLAREKPWEDLDVVRRELEGYRRGMSERGRMVVANKADLLGGESDDMSERQEGRNKAVEEARAKFEDLATYVHTEMRVPDAKGREGKRVMDVIPASAKFSQNLEKIILKMRGYVEEARDGGSTAT